MKYNQHKNNLLHSLHIQCRVLCALLLREVITRYGRHGVGVLWMVLEPMLFTFGVSILWYFIKADTLSNIPIIAFAVTGYSTVLLWRNATNRCSKAIEPNFSLMYHKNVKVFDLFVSRIILEWVGATTSFFLLTAFFTAIGSISLPKDIVPVIIGWLLLCWFSLSLGLIVGVLSELSETFERTWHIATYLMLPLSGAVYMVDWLPTGFQQVVLWVPMVHGVEMIRHGFFGDLVTTYENPAYFAVCNLILLLIGLALTRILSRRVQPGA